MECRAFDAPAKGKEKAEMTIGSIGWHRENLMLHLQGMYLDKAIIKILKHKGYKSPHPVIWPYIASHGTHRGMAEYHQNKVNQTPELPRIDN